MTQQIKTIADVKDYPSKDTLFNLYWGDFLTPRQIGERCGISDTIVIRLLKKHAIPIKATTPFQRTTHLNKGDLYWRVYGKESGELEHRLVMEKILGRKLTKEETVHHKDGNSLNNHPLNLEIIKRSEHSKIHNLPIRRPPWFYNMMIFAHVIAEMGTCERLKVGCVITNFNLNKIYCFGINGNAKGMQNCCDGEEAGKCGCIHAENNALLKVGVDNPNKVIFLTHSPCLACAKLIINSGCSHLYYGTPYRDEGPLKLLNGFGIKTCPYPIDIDRTEGGMAFKWRHPYKKKWTVVATTLEEGEKEKQEIPEYSNGPSFSEKFFKLSCGVPSFYQSENLNLFDKIKIGISKILQLIKWSEMD